MCSSPALFLSLSSNYIIIVSYVSHCDLFTEESIIKGVFDGTFGFSYPPVELLKEGGTLWGYGIALG